MATRSYSLCFAGMLLLLFAVTLLLPAPARAEALSERLSALAPHISQNVLELALKASQCAVNRGVAAKTQHLGVIDYSLPSTEKRLWIFDTNKQKLLWEEWVAHGKNTGDNYASAFSNKLGSLQSSLGLFRTGISYNGRNGYSLRLHGLEPGVNNRAFDRAIVIHGAPYVSVDFAEAHGRLGRSWGCPALRTEVATEIIDTLKDDAFLFVYYPDHNWESESSYLNSCQ